MQQPVHLVYAGRSVVSHTYGDEGQIAAVALLYYITVFTYSMQNKQWYVLNESGQRGYVCLLHLPDHCDVHHGIDGSPVINPTVIQDRGQIVSTV